MHGPIQIRTAEAKDAATIAALSVQLGYRASLRQVSDCVVRLTSSTRHAIFVAYRDEGDILGWVEVRISDAMTDQGVAEVVGLVVDERCRRVGVGRHLMGHAESWGRERSCRALRLRSNVKRDEARRFYEQLGYSIAKTSLTFRKEL